jgi:general secretion pathway protein A
MRALYHRSGGVPRLINIIADRSLAGAYARESETVTPAFVNAAANEVQPSESRVRSTRWPALIATASIAALAVISLLSWGFPMLERFRPVDAPQIKAVVQQKTDPAPLLEVPQLSSEADSDRSEPAVGSEWTTVAMAGADTGTGGTDLRPSPEWFDLQHRQAWRTMADLWQDGQNANAIASACDGVSGAGYSCFRDKGNWSRIRNLGLPVILVLQGDSPRYLVLQGFSREGLLVGSAADQVTVSPEVIEEQWLGEYMVAWPQAPDWPTQIRRGQSGAAVDIVMDMAGYAEPAWNGEGVFDSAFESWLKSFQRRNGLRADGIIGPNTLIYLMAPTIAQPRLVQVSEERS